MSTTEKKIVVTINTAVLSNLSGRENILVKAIGNSAKASKLYDYTDSLQIAIIQADLKNESIGAVVIFPQDKQYNHGRQLFEFKKLVLNDLKRANIIIDLAQLKIEFRSDEDVENILSHAQMQEQSNRQVISSSRKSEIRASVSEEGNEYNYAEKAKQFTPREPLYSFNRVILPTEVIRKIDEAIAILECEDKVFKEWGLYEIQPHPSTALSFYGPSGTGKTMAAEAVADKLGKKILKVSYADVESKYHGEGPKMIKSIFLAAENNDAVLFFDEADSLLSKRLTSVSQGSEQAINSMRSQLLICLEEFKGIVIFTTNLVINYDKAFLTRLISVEFPIPDAETRKKIWSVHIKPIDDGKEHQLNIPLASDVDTDELAARYDFVGREIRNAVVSACVNAAMERRAVLSQADFVEACDKILNERIALANAKDHTVDFNNDQEMLKTLVSSRMSENKGDCGNVSTPAE